MVTDLPLRRILHRLEMSGRMLAWSMEMGSYCLKYRPHTSMKAQVLTDFIVECSFSEGKGNEKLSQETKEGEGQTKGVSEDNHLYL